MTQKLELVTSTWETAVSSQGRCHSTTSFLTLSFTVESRTLYSKGMMFSYYLKSTTNLEWNQLHIPSSLLYEEASILVSGNFWVEWSWNQSLEWQLSSKKSATVIDFLPKWETRTWLSQCAEGTTESLHQQCLLWLLPETQEQVACTCLGARFRNSVVLLPFKYLLKFETENLHCGI